MKMKMIRQGDILLVPVSIQPPKNAEIVNSVVLAEGESTGHNHVIEANNMITWEDFVCVPDGEIGTLSHPDHDPVPAPVVPPGVYRIIRQKEYNLTGMWKQVID